MEKTQPTKIFQRDFYHKRASVPRRHLVGFEALFSNIGRLYFLFFSLFFFFSFSKAMAEFWALNITYLLANKANIERLLLIAPSKDCKMLTREYSCISQLKIWTLPERLWLHLFINLIQDLNFLCIFSVFSDFCLVVIRSLIVYDLEHLVMNSWTRQFQMLRLWQWCKTSGANCKSEIQNYMHNQRPKRCFQAFPGYPGLFRNEAVAVSCC